MNNYKDEKLAELIKNLAADFIQKESNRVSLVTVTRVVMSENLKTAQILFTVYPEEKEKEVQEFIIRRVRDFREEVRSKVRMETLPFFRFEIDKGEKNRQNLDTIAI